MGSSISAKIEEISKAVNMYLATSISHFPISRFISFSTMVQRYVFFLFHPKLYLENDLSGCSILRKSWFNPFYKGNSLICSLGTL